MLTELKSGTSVAGAKQVRRAIAERCARKVFLAEDADPAVTAPIHELCTQSGLPLEWVSSRRELGLACGLSVGCATAALL